MNIFILETDPVSCAKNMVDSHIIKMPLEHAQLLSTAYRVQKFIGYRPRRLTQDEINTLKETNSIELYEEGQRVYKATHYNHPCAIWARTSKQNASYLNSLSLAIDIERFYRFNSHAEHLSVSLSKAIIKSHIMNLPSIGLTPFVQAIPDDVKHRIVSVAYRRYYRKYKQHLFKWTNREAPKWIPKTEQNPIT